MNLLSPWPLLALLLASGSAAAATTGTLIFTGRIDAGTCDLLVGDVNRTIPLDPVKVSDFDSGTSAGRVPFELTANCDSDVTSVVFTFTGTADSDDPYRFKNTGTASGIGLYLYSLIGGTELTIRANGTDNTRTVAATGGSAVLPLGAAYFHTNRPGRITSGTLNATATVAITYN